MGGVSVPIARQYQSGFTVVITVIRHYARSTNRLANKQQKVTFEAGGEADKRLLIVLDMPVSSDSLLRLVHNAPEPEVKAPGVLGADDWVRPVPSKQAIAWGWGTPCKRVTDPAYIGSKQ